LARALKDRGPEEERSVADAMNKLV